MGKFGKTNKPQNIMKLLVTNAFKYKFFSVITQLSGTEQKILATSS